MGEHASLTVRSPSGKATSVSRRKKKSRRNKKPNKGAAGRRLRPQLEAVEFVAGHDGFMRGKPEPVIILAAFGVNAQQIALLGRALRRPTVTEPYPSETKVRRVDERQLFDVPVPLEYDRVLLLGLAIEEDGGKDVAALYGALAAPEALTSWTLGELMPQPLTLGDAGLGILTTPPSARRVHLVRDGLYCSESCRSDDWVGAAVAVCEVNKARRQQWRFQFVSEDERNDWTAVFQVRL